MENDFPKWKFHPSKDAVVVPDSTAEKALGEDWFDSPKEAKAAFEKLQNELATLERNRIRQADDR